MSKTAKRRNWTRILAWVMVVAMLSGMAPVSVFTSIATHAAGLESLGTTEYSLVDNGYLKYGVNQGDGGFYILPSGDTQVEGKPASRGWFQMDGEEVPFGAGGNVSLNQIENQIDAVWAWNGYSVTQTININADLENEHSYGAFVHYSITKDGAAVELPARIILDTRFGTGDNQPVYADVFGEFISAERTLEPAPSELRIDPALSVGEIITYAIFQDDQGRFAPPNKVDLGYFPNLASGGFGYATDPLISFADAGDSGAALSYQSAEFGFLYGFAGPVSNDKQTAEGIWPMSEKIPALGAATADTEQPYIEIRRLGQGATDYRISQAQKLTLTWTEGEGSKSVEVYGDEYYVATASCYYINVPANTLITATLTENSPYTLATNWIPLGGNTFTTGAGTGGARLEPGTLQLLESGPVTIGELPLGLTSDQIASIKLTKYLSNPEEILLSGPGTAYVRLDENICISSPPEGYRWRRVDIYGTSFVDMEQSLSFARSLKQGITYTLVSTKTKNLNVTLSGPGLASAEVYNLPASVSGGGTQIITKKEVAYTIADMPVGSFATIDVDYENSQNLSDPVYYDFDISGDITADTFAGSASITIPEAGNEDINITITAKEQTTYPLTLNLPAGETGAKVEWIKVFDVNDAGDGTISRSAAIYDANAKPEIPAGATVTIADLPLLAEGVSGVQGGTYDNTNHSYAFTMPSSAATVDVAMAAKKTHTLLLNGGENISGIALRYEYTGGNNLGSVPATLGTQSANGYSPVYFDSLPATVEVPEDALVTIQYVKFADDPSQVSFLYDKLRIEGVTASSGYKANTSGQQDGFCLQFVMPAEDTSVTLLDSVANPVPKYKLSWAPTPFWQEGYEGGYRQDPWTFDLYLGNSALPVQAITDVSEKSIQGGIEQGTSVLIKNIQAPYWWSDPKVTISHGGTTKELVPGEEYIFDITADTLITASGEGEKKYTHTIRNDFSSYGVMEVINNGPGNGLTGTEFDLFRFSVTLKDSKKMLDRIQVYDSTRSVTLGEITKDAFKRQVETDEEGNYAGEYVAFSWKMSDFFDDQTKYQDCVFYPVFTDGTVTVKIVLEGDPSAIDDFVSAKNIQIEAEDLAAGEKRPEDWPKREVFTGGLADWTESGSFADGTLTYTKTDFPTDGSYSLHIQFPESQATEYFPSGTYVSDFTMEKDDVYFGFRTSSRLFAGEGEGIDHNVTLRVKLSRDHIMPKVNQVKPIFLEGTPVEKEGIINLKKLEVTGDTLEALFGYGWDFDEIFKRPSFWGGGAWKDKGDMLYQLREHILTLNLQNASYYTIWGTGQSKPEINLNVNYSHSVYGENMSLMNYMFYYQVGDTTRYPATRTATGKVEKVEIEMEEIVLKWSEANGGLGIMRSTKPDQWGTSYVSIDPNERYEVSVDREWVELNGDPRLSIKPQTVNTLVIYQSRAQGGYNNGRIYHDIATGYSTADALSKAAWGMVARFDDGGVMGRWPQKVLPEKLMTLKGNITYENGKYYLGGGPVLINDSLIYNVSDPKGIEVSISTSGQSMVDYVIEFKGKGGKLSVPGMSIGSHDISTIFEANKWYTISGYNYEANPILSWGVDTTMNQSGFQIAAMYGFDVNIGGIRFYQISGENKIAFTGHAKVQLPNADVPITAISVPRVQFGPRSNGNYILDGLLADGEANLTASALGIPAIAGISDWAENGISGKLHIDTFEHEYWGELGLNISVLTVEGSVKFVMWDAAGMLIPDEISVYLESELIGLDLVPGMPIGSLAGIGGSIRGIGDTIQGHGKTWTYIPPLSVSIRAKMQLIELFEMDATMTFGPGGYQYSADPSIGIPGTEFEIAPFNKFEYGFNVSETQLKLYADVEAVFAKGVVEFLEGGGSLSIEATYKPFKVRFSGKLYAKLQIPEIAGFGLWTIAGATAAIGDKGVGGSVDIGAFDVYAKYTWAYKDENGKKKGGGVSFGTGSIDESDVTRQNGIPAQNSMGTMSDIYDENGEYLGYGSYNMNMKLKAQGTVTAPVQVSNQGAGVFGQNFIPRLAAGGAAVWEFAVKDPSTDFTTLENMGKDGFDLEKQDGSGWKPFVLTWLDATGEVSVSELADPKYTAILTAGKNGTNVMLLLPAGSYRIQSTSDINYAEVIAAPAAKIANISVSGTKITAEISGLKTGKEYVADVYLGLIDQDGRFPMGMFCGTANVQLDANKKTTVENVDYFGSTTSIDFVPPAELASGEYGITLVLKEKTGTTTVDSINAGVAGAFQGSSSTTIDVFDNLDIEELDPGTSKYIHANVFTPVWENDTITIVPGGNGMLAVSFASAKAEGADANVYYQIDAYLDGERVLIPVTGKDGEQIYDPDGKPEFQPFQYMVSPADLVGGQAQLMLGGLESGKAYTLKVTPYVYVEGGKIVTYAENPAPTGCATVAGAAADSSEVTLPVATPPVITVTNVSAAQKDVITVDSKEMVTFVSAENPFVFSVDAGGADVKVYADGQEILGSGTYSVGVSTGMANASVTVTATNTAGDYSEQTFRYQYDDSDLYLIMDETQVVTYTDEFTLTGRTKPGASLSATFSADGQGSSIANLVGNPSGNISADGDGIIKYTDENPADDFYVSITSSLGGSTQSTLVHVVKTEKPEINPEGTVPFVPVTGISGVPATATAGIDVTLVGVTEAADATNGGNGIVWSLKDPGLTGATLSGNTLSTTAPGMVVVTATVKNGALPDTDFSADFTISIASAQTDTGNGGALDPGNPGPVPKHEHDYGDSMAWDETSHWNECTVCGNIPGQMEHELAWVIMQEPTETEDGYEAYKCTVCGHETDTRDIPALDPKPVDPGDGKKDPNPPTENKPNPPKNPSEDKGPGGESPTPQPPVNPPAGNVENGGDTGNESGGGNPMPQTPQTLISPSSVRSSSTATGGSGGNSVSDSDDIAERDEGIQNTGSEIPDTQSAEPGISSDTDHDPEKEPDEVTPETELTEPARIWPTIAWIALGVAAIGGVTIFIKKKKGKVG